MTDTIHSQVASQILEYLRKHPDAEDTLEGITQWWMLKQRIATEALAVRGVLDRLVSGGRIARVKSPDGQIRFRLKKC